MSDAERHDLDAVLRSSAQVYTGAAVEGGPDATDLLRRSRVRKQQRLVTASVVVVTVMALAAITTRNGTSSNLETGIANQPGSTSTTSTTVPATTTSPALTSTVLSSPTTVVSPENPTSVPSTTTTTASAPGPGTARGVVVATVDMIGRDINDAGDILGLVSVDGAFRVSVWTRATGQITPIDAAIEPSAFNEQGWIAGTSADVPNRAARWTPTEGVVAITPVGANADARDLNDAGHVVGHVDGNAYLWTPENGVRPLPLPDGATASFATAINDRDEVVGYVHRADGQQHAFYWSAVTGTIDLGTLGGRISFAADINDSGTVVGHAQAVNDGPMRVFTWSVVGGMVDLGTIGYQSNAAAINNHGTIIGNWFDGSDPNFRRGFVFTPTAGMLDIGAAPRNRSALAIALNEADQVIVADAQVLLWAPTPG